MQRSHLDKIAESYALIAEGKESALVEKKDNKVSKEKMHKCTCESFYYKRLQAMKPEMAEMYLEIAEELIGRGYQNARLLDNIIESLPKEFTGHEFRSCIAAVNPRLNEAIHTAEKKQARVIAASFVESLKQARKNVGASTCWDGYKAKGTKKKNGKVVPNCVKEEDQVEEAYTVTNADKKGNTKAYQNYKAGMKGKDGKPLYKVADHMKEGVGMHRDAKTGEVVDKAEVGKTYYPNMPKKKSSVALRKQTEMKEGVRDLDPEKGTKERKERLEKKRGMKLDDHPQYKKEEVEVLGEMPYQVMGSTDGKKEKKVGKPVKSKKYADARAAELSDTHKKTGGKYRSQYVEDVETIEEKKKGLWANIHAKRKRGEKPAKPGDKDYPKTLDIEEAKKKDNSYLETDFKKRQANNEKARKDMEKMGTSMKNPHFEDVNYYDVILAYLDENNLMESVEEAEEIMMQLTGAQIVEIIDEFMNSKEESK